MLIRVGDTILNLDNVMKIDLNWKDEDEDEENAEDKGPKVVLEFALRGADELDNGQGIDHPYLEILSGKQAEAVRRYLKKRCPDLLDM